MPVLDGVESYPRVKANRGTREIPIVMLTAAAQSEMVERALKAGAEEYIRQTVRTGSRHRKSLNGFCPENGPD
jgi:CheY-like chemotaxis protein